MTLPDAVARFSRLRSAAAAVLSPLLIACAGAQSGEAPTAPPGAIPAPADASRPVDIIDDARLVAAAADPGEWLSHGRGYAEQRHSPLDQIHDGNVQQLGLAWTYDTGSTRGLEATPLVHGGVMYATGSWSVVFALDARTGVELWRYDPEVPGDVGGKACCDVVNRGVALYDGRVYVGALDGRLIALDARTGVPVWETLTVDPSKPYTITGAPRVVKGKVIIGNGGAELGVRGYVSAYDATNGELVWRFYTVPGDPALPAEHSELEMAAHTWSGEWWTLGGGGTVWDSLAYDPDLDLLYVGTGNGSPWVQEFRSPGGGDNLFLSSILALRPDTGELIWHYQTTPGESWDYTATQHMILADLEIDGTTRQVLLQAPKNGFFYVLDRATGELLSAEKYAHVTWAKRVDRETGRPVEAPGARYGASPEELFPGPSGAHNWHPMSFNPKTGLVYLPVQDMGFAYATDPDWRVRPGTSNMGIDSYLGSTSMVSGPVAGSLLAWDPVTQSEVWRRNHVRPWNGGTLTTAGNLVFQGTGNATFAAYRASDGELLFEAPAGTGIVAPPMSYAIDGEQYVAVLAGWGGGFALASGDPPAETVATGNRGRVLVFQLGGTLDLDVPEPALPPVVPIEAAIDPELSEHGAAVYHRFCAGCHGVAAVGGGTLPDLRRSSPEMMAAFPSVVLEGALVAKGMPDFGPWLDARDVLGVRDYLLEQRALLLAESNMAPDQETNPEPRLEPN